MHSVSESHAQPAAIDATLIERITHLRESVRGHKQRALALWNACLPPEEPAERKTYGRFTQQLAQCE